MSKPMTMSNATRERVKSLTDQLEAATCGLISLLRVASEAPTDATVAEKEAALRAASEKLMQLQTKLEHRDAVITELAEWASAEDCLTIADKPEKVVTHLMQAMVSNRDLKIKQLQDENAELKLRPRPETAEKNANDANAALARARDLESESRHLKAANVKLLQDRAAALDYLERHAAAWPSVDAHLDAETRGFLLSQGRLQEGVRTGPPSPYPPMGGPPIDLSAKVGPRPSPAAAGQQPHRPRLRKPLDPVAMRGNAPPVCRRCNDSHWVFDSHAQHLVMCTACPVPCDKCRQNGTGPYCATTPCSCDCHKPKDPQ